MALSYRGTMYIDVSEVTSLLTDVANKLAPEQGQDLMRRTLWATGKKVKSIVAKTVPLDYDVTQGWVRKHVGEPRVGSGLGDVSVVIPLKGARGSAGGTFPASGGYHRFVQETTQHMKNGTTRTRKAHWRNARMKVHILRGAASTMPEQMKHQGGNPPFMAKGVGFTRTTKKRFPIAHVVALSVPQMPLNQSEKKIRQDINEIMMKEFESRLNLLLNQAGGK